MHKKIALSRVFVCVLLILLTASLIAGFVAPSLAYFQSIFTSTGINSAKVELIFDRLDFTKFTEQQLTDLGLDSGAEWGTEANPYVISAKHHVQNLSVLQNTGFFREREDTNGNPIQSFFLVCNTDGTPVAINCEGMTMAPIGTHENPFTGVIDGALVSGDATYAGYGTSVSTIANLTVSTSAAEPDIGFFGYVGYEGTLDNETNPDRPTVQGYSAEIRNLTLADVTIESKITVSYVLSDWWSTLTGHKRTGDTSADNTNDDHMETHHVGIVAGHAMFATIEDISVFYSSDSVKTFSLAGVGDINYYSITGLVGMLEHVNPNTQDGNLIGGAGNSVSDGDMLVEGGFGGGGAVTGTLTGYMMAATIFNEHEMYLQSQELTTKDQYDVTEMKKRNGDALFLEVTMQERIDSRKDWENVNYHTFQDTIFTFAMSASSKYPDQVDYVQKIWKNPENATIAATDSNSDWIFATDPDPSKGRIAYKFTAIEDASFHVAGGYYVLAYQDKNGTDDNWQDDTLYLMKFNNQNTVPSAECYAIPVSQLAKDDGEVGGTPGLFDGTTDIKSFRLVSTNALFHDYAYTFKQVTLKNTVYNRPFTSPFSDIGTSLGITSKRADRSSEYPQPDVVMSDTEETIEGGTNAFAYDWQISESTQSNGKFAVYTEYSLWGYNNWRHAWTVGTFTFDFNMSSKHVEFRREQEAVEYTSYFGSSDPVTVSVNLTEAQPADPEAGTAAVEGDFIFSIYKVEVNERDTDGDLTMGEGNLYLPAKNFFPKDDTEYEFNPSQYVLEQQFQKDAQGNYVLENGKKVPAKDANGKPIYALAPIRSYNLNSGRGTYLSELNHIVKLFKPTTSNNQISYSQDGWIGQMFGNQFDTNSGGVVGTEIGTTGMSVTVPTGMISFYISEASTEKPSYINIIVAVNPGQTTSGRVGLWHQNPQPDDSGRVQYNFNMSNPDQYFDLPISKVAANDSEDRKNIIQISSYTYAAMENGSPVLDDKGKPTYTTDTDTSYIHLGGEVALVYHSFEVTTPGVYFLGSGNGSMSVAYFSVSGAAGAGADGSSASPLGNIDFVYANGTNIITVDKKFDGIQNTVEEDYTLYYPTYHFVLMLPKDEKTGVLTKIQQEEIKIYRYIGDAGPTGTRRHIRITGYNNAEVKGLADMYEDVLEPTPTS